MTELAQKMPADVDARRERAVELRRWLHRHPELSFSEAETAARVVSELEHLGIPYTYPGPGGGVIGTPPGPLPKPSSILSWSSGTLGTVQMTRLIRLQFLFSFFGNCAMPI